MKKNNKITMQRRPSDPIKHTGKIMFGIVWIIIILFFYFISDSFISSQHYPNKNPKSSITHYGVKEVHLKQSRNKTYVLNGMINNIPVTFMVDTGASTVAIPTDLAIKLNLPRGRHVVVQTASGTLSGYTSKVNKIKLGNITLKNITVVVSSYAQPHIVLLGMSALRHLDFEKKGSMLILRQKN